MKKHWSLMFATTYSCLSETAAKLSVIVFNLSKKKKKKRLLYSHQGK